MKGKSILRLGLICLAGWACLYSSSVKAGSTELAASQEADLIAVGGKIATMDEGLTVVEAVAVKDGRIIARGEDDEILKLRGPQTRVLELKGHTVIPGLIDVHAHVDGYAMSHYGAQFEPSLKAVFVSGEDAKKTREALEKAVRERAEELGPGKWILAQPRGSGVNRFEIPSRVVFGYTRAELDKLAPRNPLFLIAPPGQFTMNSLALEEFKKVLPGVVEKSNNPKWFRGGGVPAARLAQELAVKDSAKLAQILKLELEEFATYGITTVATHVSSPRLFSALQLLDKKGELPVRFAWVDRLGELAANPYDFYLRQANMVGQGDSFLWNVGAGTEGFDSATVGACTTARLKDEAQIKFLKETDIDVCAGAYGGPYRVQMIQGILEGGHRMAMIHGSSDRTVDTLLQMIEEAMKKTGATVEEVRAKAFTLEHCILAPRPDQIPKLAHYGIRFNCSTNMKRWPPTIIRWYGEEYLKWWQPYKSMIDGGIPTGTGGDSHYNPPDESVWEHVEFPITRDVDGKVWVPEERVDRITGLRMWTSWAAENVLQGDQLGSLEAGKRADFIVLSKDYFTIPETEIRTIETLVTVIDGKIKYVSPRWGPM